MYRNFALDMSSSKIYELFQIKNRFFNPSLPYVTITINGTEVMDSYPLAMILLLCLYLSLYLRMVNNHWLLGDDYLVSFSSMIKERYTNIFFIQYKLSREAWLVNYVPSIIVESRFSVQNM